MMENELSSKLSERGQDASRPTAARPLWDILDDLWHPQDNPNGFVNLGVAENALMHDEIAEFINNSFRIVSHGLTYGDSPIGSKRLRIVLADFVNHYFSPITPIKREHIIVTNGVTTAIEACAWAFGNAGDGILLGRPHYGSFPADFGSRAGVKAVGVAFDDVDPFSLDGVAKYEEALLAAKEQGVDVKALMLCTPHNPLGRCYPRDVIISLMTFCQKYNIHFISDEIYAFSVWHNEDAPDATTFTSAFSVDLQNVIDPSLVHVLWGLSKDFCANGLRLGCIISQNNPSFIKAVSKNGLFHYPSSPSDAIAISLLSNHPFIDSFTHQNALRIAENYKFATALLREHGIPYYEHCNAAFFLWIDLKVPFRRIQQQHAGNGDVVEKSDAEVSKEIMGRMLGKKVFLASGENFGGEKPGWFRVVFTQPRECLVEGLERVVAALR